MDSLASGLATPGPTRPERAAPTALDTTLGHEWVVLQGCRIGATPPVVVEHVLLHPRIGMALFHREAEGQAAALLATMRQSLDAAGFRRTFGAFPPMVACPTPQDPREDLRPLLDEAFRAFPPVALPHGNAWAWAARGILVSGARFNSVPEWGTGRGATRPAGVPAPGMPAEPLARPRLAGTRSGTALLAVWATLAVTVLGGIAVLDYLGPPEEQPGRTMAFAPPRPTGPLAPPDPSQADIPQYGARAVLPAALPAALAADPLPVLRPVLRKASTAGQPLVLPASQDIAATAWIDIGRVDPWSDGAASPDSMPAITGAVPGPEPLACDAGEACGATPLLLLRPALAPTATLQAAGIDHPTHPAASAAPLSFPAAGRLDAVPELVTPQMAEAAPSEAMQGTSPETPAGLLWPSLEPIAPPRPDGDAPVVAHAPDTLPVPPTGAKDAAAEASPAPAPDAGTASPAAATEWQTAADRTAPAPTAPPPPAMAALADPVAGTGLVARPGASVPAPAATPVLAADTVALLLRRGEAMLASGDVSAARLLLGRAASAGSGAAARTMGKTYDPGVLASLGTVGIRPEPAVAADWYRRAATLQDAEAETRLRQLEAAPKPD